MPPRGYMGGLGLASAIAMMAATNSEFVPGVGQSGTSDDGLIPLGHEALGDGEADTVTPASPSGPASEQAHRRRMAEQLQAAQRQRAERIALAKATAERRADIAMQGAAEKRERIARRNRQNATGMGGKLRRLGVEVDPDWNFRLSFLATTKLSADVVEALLVNAEALDYAAMWNLSPEVVRSIEA